MTIVSFSFFFFFSINITHFHILSNAILLISQFTTKYQIFVFVKISLTRFTVSAIVTIKIAFAFEQLENSFNFSQFNNFKEMLDKMNFDHDINKYFNLNRIFATMIRSLNNSKIENYFVNFVETKRISKKLKKKNEKTFNAVFYR